MTALRWPIVLFDLDGTLANTIDVIVSSYIHTCREVIGREVTRDEVLPWIGRTLHDLFYELSPEKADELEQCYLDHNAEHLHAMVKPYPGIPELLAELNAAGARTGIVTSKRRRTAVPTMQLAQVPAETVLAVAMDDTDVHKPDPTPLFKALELFGGQPEQAVYIGDAIHDLAAANAAGMAGIGVSWGAGTKDSLLAMPHYAVVDDADELRNVLLN